jgi:hypothetical protein
MKYSIEELKMIQQYIFHGFILDMLDLEREKLKHMKGMLRSISEEINEAIFDRVHRVMIDLRKEFKAREIKVVDRGQREGVMWYEIWCKGYNHNHGIWREHAKSEIARILGGYSSEVEKKMWAAR